MTECFVSWLIDGLTGPLNHKSPRGLSPRGQPIVRRLSWAHYASATLVAAITSANGTSPAAPKRG